MIATLAISFVLLLFLGMPIGLLMLASTTLTVLCFTQVPLTILAQQLFNALDKSVLLSVPFFVLAGGIMTEGALARRLIAVMELLVGGIRGGSAMAAVVACVFFAALSGSSPATVVAIGSVMYPALTRAGYAPRFTAGLLATAGSLGIVIPPSIPMILYCLVMNVSVARLFMAGVVPGLMIGGALMLYTYLLARRNNWRTTRHRSRSEALAVLREGTWGLLLPGLVLGGIYSGVFTPTEAAAVSVIYALAVEFFVYRELTVKKLLKVASDAGILSASLLFILACAMTMVWLLTAQEIPVTIADWLLARVGQGWLFLLLVIALFLLLGTVMDDVSAMIILSPLFAEALDRFGIDLIHYGIVMILVIEFGFLTPPFGLNLFVVMGLTKKSLTEISRAVTPFLILLLACVLLIAFIPGISLFLPNLFLMYLAGPGSGERPGRLTA